METKNMTQAGGSVPPSSSFVGYLGQLERDSRRRLVDDLFVGRRKIDDLSTGERVSLLVNWMIERERVRTGTVDQPDPIIPQYRFCNVNREHDRVTRWIDHNIRQPLAQHPLLWLNLVVARYINWPPALQALGVPFTSTDWSAFIKAGREWRSKGNQLFGSAYVVHAGDGTVDKIQHLVDDIFVPLLQQADSMESLPDTCASWADLLMTANGVGPFMANQIVTDLKYTRYLRAASDRRNFVLAGPGTCRGLNRLWSRPVDRALSQDVAHDGLIRMRGLLHITHQEAVENDLLNRWENDAFNAVIGYIDEDLNNLSNCFCEYDKYLRALGGRRPKQNYRSHTYPVKVSDTSGSGRDPSAETPPRPGLSGRRVLRRCWPRTVVRRSRTDTVGGQT